MSTFLKDVRKSAESRYMAKKDHDLIAKIQDTMAREASAAAMNAAGLTDETLVNALLRQGIRIETLPILHLVPLIQVAWSDGEMQSEERNELERAAEEAKIDPDSPAYAIFRDMLHAPPPQEIYDAALTYIHLILSSMSEEEAASKRENLQSLADTIAHASGKLLGFFGGVQAEEREVLKSIAGRLQDRA